MNKYNKAFTSLVIMLSGALREEFIGNEKIKEDLDTLQELIDNYSKISQFDRAVFFNSKGVCVNGNTYEQLEKALDKACDELFENKFCPHFIRPENCTLEYVSCKDCLKEYLLKESEKEND